jgi:hypothetical protein
MNDLPTPELKFFADLTVLVDTPQEVGMAVHGKRRVIPILGGDVQGQGWTARVLRGGADFQLIVNQTLAELDARYVLETDAGDLIFVQNRAVRTASPEVMAKLIQGEKVDPQMVYFRCTPQFETSSKSLAWISERMFIGTGARQPNRVVMRFFEVM